MAEIDGSAPGFPSALPFGRPHGPPFTGYKKSVRQNLAEEQFRTV